MKNAWRLEVKWWDAKLDNGGWQTTKSSLANRKSHPCYSVGFVLADDKRGIVLASSVYANRASGIVHIPAGMIVSRRRLKR